MEFLISYDQDKKNTPIVRKLTEETEVRLRMSERRLGDSYRHR